MEKGKVHIGSETIEGVNGNPVEVSDEAFDILVPMKDWKGVWKERRDKK